MGLGRLVIALITILVVLIMSNLLLMQAARSLRRWGRLAKPSPADTAIVLGAYTDGYRPGHALTSRLTACVELYRNFYVRYIIVSGGKGSDESVTESSSMKHFLVMNGIPPEVIVEERLSTDTWENLKNSQLVMQRFGWTTAVIVTSDYHLRRALAVAKHLDMSVTGYAAWSDKSEFRLAVREVLAMTKYAWSGQLSF